MISSNAPSNSTVELTAEQIPSAPVLCFLPANHIESGITIDVIMSILKCVSNVIPLVGSVVDIPATVLLMRNQSDMVLNFLMSASSVIKQLTKSEIGKSQEKFATSYFDAEITAIKNRLEGMSETNDLAVHHIVPALHSCEKLFELFKDENYAFRSNPLQFSEYFVPFVALYAGIMSHAIKRDVLSRSRFVDTLTELIKYLDIYMEETVAKRHSYFKLSITVEYGEDGYDGRRIINTKDGILGTLEQYEKESNDSFWIKLFRRVSYKLNLWDDWPSYSNSSGCPICWIYPNYDNPPKELKLAANAGIRYQTSLTDIYRQYFVTCRSELEQIIYLLKKLN